MQSKRLNELIVGMESFLECWKQFNQYLNLARTKKFSADDEAQFLEVKSTLAQQLEMIAAHLGADVISRDEFLKLLSDAASVRGLGELNEPTWRNMETQWNRRFIHMNSVLGQLKEQQKELDSKSLWASLFGKK